MIIPFAFALMMGAPPAVSAAPPPLAVPATTFAARVLRGKLVEAGPSGPAYQNILWAQLDGPTTEALTACIRDNAPADKSPFTLVADVQPDGKPDAVEVQPATPVASCLAAWFATTRLPPPPRLPDTSTYPLEIEVSISP